METRNFKSLLVAGIVTAGTIVSNQAFAKYNPEPSMAGNRLAATREHQAIRMRIAQIDNHEACIDELMVAKKQARKAGRDEEVEFYKQALRKEHADLRRDRSYLEAEKDAYLYDQKMDIKAAREAKCDHKKELREAKRDLKRDIRKGDDLMMVEHAQHLAILERMVSADEARVDDLEDQYDGYTAYIRQEIRNANGETA
jgi:hypothetical protein